MSTTAKQEEMSQFRIRATKAWVVGGVVMSLGYVVALLFTLSGHEVPLILFPVGFGPFLFPCHVAAVFLTRETSFAAKWKIWSLVINIIGALVSLALLALAVSLSWFLRSC